ncbi:ribonuclease H-like domain-containing protein [Tanacetum coccineum]
MLLMALPNEHLLTFNQYKDAKTLFAAIQTRFGGNDATKKTQKTLLKKMYENFSASSTESFDFIFNRLQKIVSQLAILGENISQEDLNLKFLRSLPSEWNTHVVELQAQAQAQFLRTMSSTSSTNEVNTAYGVSTANTQASTTSTQVSTTNLSDDTVYAFLASQPNGSQLVHKDLEQIHEDDLEEIDLKCFMADEEVPTDMTLMAFSDSEVHNNKTFSKTCLKSFETLKTQLDDLRIEFNKSEFNLATYKRGLAYVEEQLVFYKKNKVLFCEKLAVLKRDISYKDSEISVLKSELEKLKQEKESNQLKIEKFDNASKSLDKLIGSQIPNKSRKGLGFVTYNALPPPPIVLFSPLNLDLSNSSLEEFQHPEFEGYGPKTSKSVSEDTSNEVRESPDASLVEELVSNDKLEKKTVFPTIAKINFVRPQQQEKPVRKPVKYAEMYRLTTITIKGKEWNIVPRAVLMKIGLRPLNTARPVNTAHPKTIVYSARPMPHFSKSVQSTVKMPYQIRTTLTKQNFSQKINTAKGKFYTARLKVVNTAKLNSAVVNAVRENQVNAVKASACWVWRPTKLNSASITLKRHNYVDARDKSKSVMAWGTCPISQTLRNLMEDMLQFNLFSVSHMCDKKNTVIFTDTGCFALSPDFKLADESQVLLKVPRKNNIYSVDMKNIIPKESLICLVAKATLDESMLWHRRLGHVKFKTINKLVKENLVRGLPTKRFENDQTCVACLKGKQHKASFMSEFCEEKGIKNEFSIARTPQQNGVAEKRNMTLIEAARTMLADSKLPTIFWAKAVNTACYVQNRA